MVQLPEEILGHAKYGLKLEDQKTIYDWSKNCTEGCYSSPDGLGFGQLLLEYERRNQPNNPKLKSIQLQYQNRVISHRELQNSEKQAVNKYYSYTSRQNTIDYISLVMQSNMIPQAPTDFYFSVFKKT